MMNEVNSKEENQIHRGSDHRDPGSAMNSVYLARLMQVVDMVTR